MRQGHETNPLTRKAAKRLGLQEGIPVAGPYLDHEAGFMSAMDVSDHVLQCSLGTAWVANFALPGDAAWTSPTQLVLPPAKGSGWLVVQPLATGNFAWDWMLKEFVDPDISRAIAKLPDIFSRQLLPPRGLTALPQVNAPNPLCSHNVGAGMFAGLGLSTTRDDMVRAMAAAMTYEMARMVHELIDRRIVDSVVLGGGASKGPFFRSLLAALFEPLPVHFLRE